MLNTRNPQPFPAAKGPEKTLIALQEPSGDCSGVPFQSLKHEKGSSFWNTVVSILQSNVGTAAFPSFSSFDAVTENVLCSSKHPHVYSDCCLPKPVAYISNCVEFQKSCCHRYAVLLPFGFRLNVMIVRILVMFEPLMPIKIPVRISHVDHSTIQVRCAQG